MDHNSLLHTFRSKTIWPSILYLNAFLLLLLTFITSRLAFKNKLSIKLIEKAEDAFIKKDWFPRELRNKWYTYKYWQTHPWPNEIIDIRKMHVSCFKDSDSIEDIENSKGFEYASPLIGESAHVQLLNRFKDQEHVTDDEILSMPYCQLRIKELLVSKGEGSSNNNEIESLRAARSMINLYKRIKKNPKKRSIAEELTRGLAQEKRIMPWVFRIKDSDQFMIWDGHHRLACHYVLGNYMVRVKVIGTKENALQRMDYKKAGCQC